MDALRGWRQPVAIVLIVALALRVVLGLLLLPVSGPLTGTGDLVLVIAAAAAAAWCVRPEPSPRARAVLTAALVVTGAAVLLALVLAVVGLSSSVDAGWLWFAITVTELVVPGMTVVVLAGLLARASAPASLDQPAPEIASADQPTLPAVRVEQQPGWQPDQAAGAVWYTAGEAAAGAPATGWGQPENPAGWQPVPRWLPPEEQPEEPESSGGPTPNRPPR